jgi:prevent-host-death family protein
VKTANVTEAKATLSKLLAMVQEGDEIILTKAGVPVAKLVPYRGPARRTLGGSWEGRVEMADDFDEFPEELLTAFAGEVEPG